MSDDGFGFEDDESRKIDEEGPDFERIAENLDINPDTGEYFASDVGIEEDLTLADRGDLSDELAEIRERSDLPDDLEFEGEVHGDFNYSAFNAAVEAVQEMDHWNPNPLNGYQSALDMHQSSYGSSSEETTYGEILDQETANPVRWNTFRGEAGQLSVTERGELFPSTEMSYSSADDARPESEQVHGVLMHAAGVLAQYDAETEGDGIRVESLDRSEAEEVAQAYTVIDSALTSESFDQRTVAEQLNEIQEESGYGISRPDSYDLKEI